MLYAQIIQCALMGKYANIDANYELTGMNHVTRSTVHRLTMPTQLDHID